MTIRAKFGVACMAFAFLFVTAGEGFAAQPRTSTRSQSGTPSAQAQRGATPNAGSAAEKAPKIVVLPFQINAGPAQERLNDELPAMLEHRLAARGVAVVSESTVRAQMRKDRITTLNIQTARQLTRKLGGTAAVYGSYSQMGRAFSIDARYVEAGDGGAVKPVFVERTDAGELLPGVDELATKVTNEISRRDVLAGVEVKGTRVLDPDVVLMRINSRKGDPLDVNAVDSELKKVWDLGYFSDVSADVEQREDGMYLVYTVKEKPRIASIRVVGNKDVDESDILAAMSTRTGTVLNERLLVEDLQKVREVFRQAGYYLATAEPKVDTGKDGTTATLVLHISEGNKLYIKSVKLEGAQGLSESSTKGEMALAERGMFSWITGSGVLKEELLDRDSSAITGHYLNNGYLDIVVGAARVEYEQDGISITFPINEGERYKLGDILFEGDIIDTDAALKKVIVSDDDAADGEFFNLSVMQNDTKKLTDFYAEYGYAFAEVNPMPRKRADGTKVVDVAFGINKKQKVYIHRAIVEGNTRTRDNVILRELRLTDGDMFSSSKLQRSIDRLNKTGFFEVAEAELIPMQKEEEVDLKITVKEKNTGAIMGGFGYSTYSQFGVTGRIAENNLFGKGYSLSFQADVSGMRTAYTARFFNPRINDTNLGFGVELYNLRDDYWDYMKKTTGGIARVVYPLGEYSSVSAGYRLDLYKLYDVDDDASFFIKDYAGDNRISSVGLFRFTRDTTNSMYATAGSINRLFFDYGGGFLAGDDDFIRLTFEHQTYYELMRNHVLHFRTKVGGIFKNGSDEVPVFERFWLGGMDSVRGYRSRDIVPRDPKTRDRIGGTRMAYANFEYLYAINTKLGLSLVPFFDIGMNLDTDNTYNLSDEIIKSTGLELRWRSPMGDLRFAYGYPLDKDRWGRKQSGRFEFSMGHMF